MSKIRYEEVVSSAKLARSSSEDNLRKQLAYLYHIFNYYGWDDLIVTHLSVRILNQEALLIIPFGLSFNEITPDNLVKVDFSGKVLESRCGFGINKNGTTVHRAIYRNYPEVNCILHTHSHYGVAVSNIEEKLMLLDQIAMMFHQKVGYHDFDTLFINDNDQNQLLKDMKGLNCIILRNHGLLSVGNTIAEAFWFHYYLETTCKLQVLTMSTGGKIHYPSEDAVKTTHAKYEGWRGKNDHLELSDSELLFEAAKRKVGYIFG